MFKVLERIFRDKIATEPVSLSGSQRFRGKLSGSVEESLLPRCQGACPVGAFQVEGSGYRIDYKRCIFCGRCVEACAMAALEEGREDGDMLHHSAEDAMPYLLEAGQEALAEVL